MDINSLMSCPDLGLETVVAAGLDRQVAGAHVIEIEDPGRWILPGYLVLTTGVTFASDEDSQRAFVRSLQAAGAAGVVYALGVVTKTPPPGLVAACRAANLALLTAPPAVAFRDVVATVMIETAVADAHDVASIVATQDLLIGALDHPAPQEALVKRLWDVFRLPVGVVSATGMLVNQCGPDADAAAMTAASLQTPGLVTVDGSRFLVADVRASEPTSAMHLVLQLPDNYQVDQVLRSAAAFAARILKMVATTRQVQRDFERRMGASVCQALLDPNAVLTRSLREEAASLGLTGQCDLTVLRISGLEERGRANRDLTPLHRLGNTVFDFMDSLRVPYVAAAERDGFLVITQGADIEQRVKRLASTKRAGCIAVGLSSTTRALETLPHLATEAQLAHRRLSPESGARVATATFHSDNVADLVMAYVPQAARHGLADVLAPLEDRPELIDTLQGFLANRRDITATASEMYLHPNSIRYRLAKVEDLLGCSLDETDVVVAVHVALQERAAGGRPVSRSEHVGARS